MVMLWLEGGQVEVRGAPPPPYRPSQKPPSQGAFSQRLVGGVVGVQDRGLPPPPPRVTLLQQMLLRTTGGGGGAPGPGP